jgi:predicted metal-binding membrane protein
MLIAVGHGLWLMGAFTLVMLAEKVLPRGLFLARATGAVLIALSAAIALANIW